MISFLLLMSEVAIITFIIFYTDKLNKYLASGSKYCKGDYTTEVGMYSLVYMKEMGGFPPCSLVNRCIFRHTNGLIHIELQGAHGPITLTCKTFPQFNHSTWYIAMLES